jgi:hypothetical protein
MTDRAALVKELTIGIAKADDFGAELLTATIDLIRAEVLEEAAGVAETPIRVECCQRPKINRRGEEECCGGPDAVWGNPGEIAAAIRALKGTT